MREEKNRTSQKIGNMKKKRWLYPALYLVLAAIAVSGILWYNATGNNVAEQGPNGEEIAGQGNEEAVEVNASFETLSLPVLDADAAEIFQGFYDPTADAADQEAALVVFNDQYHQNQGLNIKNAEGTSFEVVAALSGTVAAVQEDALLGNVIEIDHGNGVMTHYSSVTNMEVAAGDIVKKGQPLGSAGTSMFNKEAGTHVHFEVRHNGEAINPETYLNQPLASLLEARAAQEEKAEEEATENTDDNAAGETSEESDAETGADTNTESDADAADDTEAEAGDDTDANADDNNADAEADDQADENATESEDQN